MRNIKLTWAALILGLIQSALQFAMLIEHRACQRRPDQVGIRIKEAREGSR